MKNITLFSILLLLGCRSPDRYWGHSNSTIISNNKLAVFIDGTGKSTGDNTEIFRMFNAIDTSMVQAFYTEGLGTGLRLLGVPFGSGIRKDIRDGYAFICKNYRLDTEIYLFGYSRGAFSVRSMASMIAVCGILNLHEIEDDGKRSKFLKRLYTTYHGKGDVAERKNKVLQFIKEWNSKNELQIIPSAYPDIEAMGLYDSVEALGMQDGKEATCCPNGYHLTSLCNVKRAYQVLSLDDNRANVFTPLFLSCPCSFDGCQESTSKTEIKEVWFSGSHKDIGVGSLNSGHCVNWLLDEMKGTNLFVDTTFRASIIEPLHDAEGSISGLFYKRKNRSIWDFVQHFPDQKIVIHPSVIERIKLGVSGYDSEWYLQKPFNQCFTSNGKGFDFNSNCSVIEVMQ